MRSCHERERGVAVSSESGEKLDSEILEKRKEKEEQRAGKACKGTKQAKAQNAGKQTKTKAGVKCPQQSHHCATRWELTQASKQTDKAGKSTRQAKVQNASERRKPKRKSESRIPSRVATVVIPKFGSSMQDAKARVH